MLVKHIPRAVIPELPGLHVLRAGTLDNSPALQPVAHIWVQHKQAWLTLPDGIPSWPRSPTPEAFAAALS
ncbi:GFA family protein [Pseudomonas gingeri]|uniref:GFA family protein n=1 Tax=Pseudomonas gingeri TaxID=117681 RepID=UPI00210D7F96|nr:GFA family protein [Pseudomonas gingeri]